MGTDIVGPPDARELTKEEHERWVTAAFTLEQAFKEGMLEARGGLWKAAEALYHFHEISGWSALSYEKISHWLADPDISMTSATYYRLKDCWRELAVYRKFDLSTLRELDLAKVQIALPALRHGKVVVEEMFDDVRSMGAADLREKYTLAYVNPNTPPSLEVPPEPEPAESHTLADGTESYARTNGTMPEYADLDEQVGGADLARLNAIGNTLTFVCEQTLSRGNRKRFAADLWEALENAVELAHSEGWGNG